MIAPGASEAFPAVPLAVRRMSALATAPYRRGAEVLAVPLGAEEDGWTAVPAYDFREYEARHGEPPPAPCYVLAPTRRVGEEGATVEVELDHDGELSRVKVGIPPGALPGLSFVVPLGRGLEELGPSNPGPKLRLVRLRVVRGGIDAPGLSGAESWRVTALLGNLSKLLWVLGRERDEIRAQMADVAAQRCLPFARGGSLDLLGRGLRVPRFPPREHSFDPDTLALYHCNEYPIASGDPVADETSRFGAPGHPGVAEGELSGSLGSGAPGKFGRGLVFPGPSGSGMLRISHHRDFNLLPGRSTTVELFVRVDTAAEASSQGERALIVKGALHAGGQLSGRGWALTLGTHRGLPHNPRWSLRSASSSLDLFGDVDLGDGAFHHLAAVLDRDTGRALLYVDGAERARADASELGKVGNSQMVRCGRSAAGHPFFGTIDELRVSGVARKRFHPVLGEGDEAYRRRLRLFERWVLPTADELRRLLNEAVSIAGEEEPLVLVERDAPRAAALASLRLVPAAVPLRGRFGPDGETRQSAAEVCGDPEDEPAPHPEFLVTDGSASTQYPGGDGDRRMQSRTLALLNALRQSLAEEGGGEPLAASRPTGEAGEGQTAAEAALGRRGRALLLDGGGVDRGRLAALAHRVGFQFVHHRGHHVLVALSAGPLLTVEASKPASGEAPEVGDLHLGDALDLTVLPGPQPAAARFTWRVLHCGAGAGHLEGLPGDEGNPRPVEQRPSVRLVADGPGEVTVSVEVRLRGRTASGARTFRFVPAEMEKEVPIAADGRLGLTLQEAVAPPEDDFNAAYLVKHGTDAAIEKDSHRLMQVGLDRRLERLTELLGKPGLIPGLRVLDGFEPDGEGLAGVARQLVLRHDDLPSSRLAALAHQAGFDWVMLAGEEVTAAVDPGPRLEIVDEDGQPLPETFEVGRKIGLAVRPAQKANAGLLNWSVESAGLGADILTSATLPETVILPRQAGWIDVRALFFEESGEATPPYAFEVRLRDDLEADGVIVPKTEYDLIMNILSFFHPVGVEVLTRRLRQRVVEVRDDQLTAYPGYTYPDFRV